MFNKSGLHGCRFNIHHPVFSAFLDLKNEFSKIDEEDGAQELKYNDYSSELWLFLSVHKFCFIAIVNSERLRTQS